MAEYVIDNLPESIDFQAGNLLRRTLQNAKNLLMCRAGEVPYDRNRGLDPTLFDKPLGELRLALLPEVDRVMLYEPDVKVADATATLLEDMTVYIRVILEIDIDPQA